MSFIEIYLLISVQSLAILTLPLKDLFTGSFKYARIIAWITIGWVILFGLSPYNFLWLLPLSFLLPYILSKISDKLLQPVYGSIFSIAIFSLILIAFTYL